eukprot:13176386-Heterocapsa_arctica.AAC.1
MVWCKPLRSWCRNLTYVASCAASASGANSVTRAASTASRCTVLALACCRAARPRLLAQTL